MKPFLSILTILMMSAPVLADVFVVSPNGRDSNPGTENAPWQSIQKAADTLVPGDTVYVREGEYTKYLHAGATISIHQSGEPDAYIVFMAYPGERPKIVSPTWNAFDLRGGVAYIEINGFEIEGVPHAMSDSSGNGIYCSDGTHHIRILNNEVYNCPGGGIGSSRCDYLHIEGNVVHHNCLYSGYQNSGISLYQNINVDDEPGYHNIIRGNICYANENRRLPLWGGDKVTDGNGIIIDDSRNEQGDSPHPPYTGATLIENNLVFDNGGRGIHMYLSDYIDVINNTLYKNSRSKDINDGELTAINSGDVTFLNNIVYTLDRGRGNKTFQATDVRFDYNLYYNARYLSETGEHSLRDVDPLFVHAEVDADVADFRLLPSSPAINAGTVEKAPEIDLNGVARNDGSIDLGAFEYHGDTGVVNSDPRPQRSVLVKNYPNPFNSTTTISYYLPEPADVRLDIFDVAGRLLDTIVHENKSAGTHTQHWDGTHAFGISMSSGVYMYRLCARTAAQTLIVSDKMILAK